VTASVLVIASDKKAIIYHESTKVLKYEKIKQLDFLGLAGFGH